MENNFRESYPSPTKLYLDSLTKKVLRNFLISEKEVLEIGCGTGHFLFYIKDHVKFALGVDLDEKAVESAKLLVNSERSERVKIKCMDFFCIKKKFDFIFLFDVLEHIEDDNLALKKISKLLKQNGMLLFSVPGNSKLYGKKDILHGHYRRYEKDELENKLNPYFSIIYLYSFGSPILAKINRKFIQYKGVSDVKCNLREQTIKSAYCSPSSKLIKVLYPIYSRFPFILKFYDLFLNTKFMNCHYLCLCQVKD